MIDLTRLTAMAARGAELRGPRPTRPNASGQSWYRITAAAGARSTVYIYDLIGEFGVSAAQFVHELNGIGADGIDVHFNSPGGDYFDGTAIYAALKNHPSDVTSYVDSVAASAASFVAMAGDTIVMEKPAKLMIHDASGLTYGNQADHLEMANLLGELSDTMAAIYADRAGGTVASWRAAQRATTWYSAEQAVAAGLADRVAGAPAGKSSAPDARRTQLIRARARVTLKGGNK